MPHPDPHALLREHDILAFHLLARLRRHGRGDRVGGVGDAGRDREQEEEDEEREERG